MGLYANQALVELLCKAGRKLKEKKDRRKADGEKDKRKGPQDKRVE